MAPEPGMAVKTDGCDRKQDAGFCPGFPEAGGNL